MKLRIPKKSAFLFQLVFSMAFLPSFVFGQVNAPVANYSVYCQGDKMLISATSSTQNASIEWYMSNNVNATQPFTISQNGEIFPLDSIITFGLGRNKIYAVASLNGSKSSSVEVPITIDKKAVVIAIESDGCMLNRGDNVTFSPILENSNGNYTYEWRKIKTKLMAEITNPAVLSTTKNFSKSSLTEEDAGIYELTVWNENQTCATKIEAPHLIIRGVCMPDYPISNYGYLYKGLSSYVSLTEDLSSSYYSTFHGFLSFKFYERYREGMLEAYLYNAERCKIGTLRLEKNVGKNWYSLDLNPVCTPGEYYVMEAFDENGQRSVLNFIFEGSAFKANFRNSLSVHCPFFISELSILIEGAIGTQKIIWYVTSSNTEQEVPNQSSNWERVDWMPRDRFDRTPSLYYTTTENEVYWFKAKIIDSRGCSVETPPYSLLPEESTEHLFTFPNQSTDVERAEYVSSRNSSLLKGIQLKAGFLENNNETSDIVISILDADGINQSPKTVLKSVQMSARDFKNQVSQRNNYLFLFDQLLEVSDNFYISVKSNTNLFFWKGACNIPNEANKAWEKTDDGKWQSLSTPIAEGGVGISTSYSIYPVFDGKPIIDFVADFTLALPNEEIEFSDLSGNAPISLEWIFEGATVSQSDKSIVKTKYTKEGEYDVLLEATNFDGTTQLRRQDYIKIIENYLLVKNTEGRPTVLENSIGFVAGHNAKNDKAKAEYFSGFQNAVLEGVEIYLSALEVQGNENKLLRIDVLTADSYDKSPKVLVDSVFVPFYKLKKLIDKYGFVRIRFDRPIEVLGDFYVSVNLNYYDNHRFSILTTPASLEKENTAWTQLADNAWQPYSKSKSEGGKGILAAHAIYPIMTSNKILSSEEQNSFAENIKLFPNPASDFIAIEANSIELKNYSIVNVLGTTIKTGVLPSDKTIQINNLPKGLYFVRFETTKGMITKRFVVN